MPSTVLMSRFQIARSSSRNWLVYRSGRSVSTSESSIWGRSLAYRASFSISACRSNRFWPKIVCSRSMASAEMPLPNTLARSWIQAGTWFSKGPQNETRSPRVFTVWTMESCSLALPSHRSTRQFSLGRAGMASSRLRQSDTAISWVRRTTTSRWSPRNGRVCASLRISPAPAVSPSKHRKFIPETSSGRKSLRRRSTASSFCSTSPPSKR